MPICPVCSNELNDKDVICDVCGAHIVTEAEKTDSNNARATSKHSKTGRIDEVIDKLPFNFEKKHFRILCICLIGVFLFSFVISFFKPSVSKDYLLYAKDNEIFFSDTIDLSPKQVTVDYANEYFDNNLGRHYRLSDDGSCFFYFDYGTNNLYARSADCDDEPKFIASNIISYDVNDSCDLITYIKDGNILYQHNMDEQLEIIDSEVISFVASDDGETIIYTKQANNANNLYIYESGNKPEEIVASFDNLFYLSDDLCTIYYTKKGYLFRENIGEKPQKIDSNVQFIINVYDSGEVYYTKTNPDTFSESLYYYDGDESLPVFEDFSSLMDYSENNPVIAFNASKEGVASVYVATEDNVETITKGTVVRLDIDPSGESIYYITNYSNSEAGGDLYRYGISNGDKPEHIDSGVFDFSFFAEDEFAYFKDYSQETATGDIYINGDHSVKDVSWNGTVFMEENGGYAIFKGGKTNLFDLIYYRDGDVKELAKNVLASNVQVTSDGKLLYLADYNFSYSVGELYIFDGDEAESVDVGVSYIADAYSTEEARKLLKSIILS